MNRYYYSDTIEKFIATTPDMIIGKMAIANAFPLEQSQRHAWLSEMNILQSVLQSYSGKIYFEYSIPRMGKRIDVILIIGPILFVLEFKIGATVYDASSIDQVIDYALDLKNFHSTSHELCIAPVLIATHANNRTIIVSSTPHNDNLLYPTVCNSRQLGEVIEQIISFTQAQNIDPKDWEKGNYCPTPTIIEAAIALYSGHSVKDISRSDANAINLSKTSDIISSIIRVSRDHSQKSICFVTGVPGAGKTLVGLNIATTHIDKDNDLYSVFLSGNGPLVTILREALARDNVQRKRDEGIKVKKGEALSEVKAFIQNVHHFRDECLVDSNSPPIEHVALFDEAQRAWDLEQTSNFMRLKKNIASFNQSEPDFLISCLDRHSDWAVVVCLVGGGQEINTGEAGISEWLKSLKNNFPNWHIYISSKLFDSEYNASTILGELSQLTNINHIDDLHLSVSMRSFRAENVSLLIKQILDNDMDQARNTLRIAKSKYPIVLTRDIAKAKLWLKQQARGSERYGIIVSSQAERLKPQAIDVRSPIDPVHWFLDGKDDVRSSYYLEDVATEFHIQGLELDWVCVTWDADFRYSENTWDHWSFCGTHWRRIHKDSRKLYQKNAYRVLLTRARQGMVIVVPHGDLEDPTRNPAFYDSTFEYLKEIGFEVI